MADCTGALRYGLRCNIKPPATQARRTSKQQLGIAAASGASVIPFAAEAAILSCNLTGGKPWARDLSKGFAPTPCEIAPRHTLKAASSSRSLRACVCHLVCSCWHILAIGQSVSLDDCQSMYTV